MSAWIRHSLKRLLLEKKFVWFWIALWSSFCLLFFCVCRCTASNSQNSPGRRPGNRLGQDTHPEHDHQHPLRGSVREGPARTPRPLGAAVSRPGDGAARLRQAHQAALVRRLVDEKWLRSGQVHANFPAAPRLVDVSVLLVRAASLARFLFRARADIRDAKEHVRWAHEAEEKW